MAGAVFYAAAGPARAQAVPAPSSEVPIPIKPKTDTTRTDSAIVRRDTIQPPVGRFSDPAAYEITPRYEWNRAELFATGALTLIDLLDRIPELTTFRSGWIATPQVAAMNGDFRRVRVFYDDIEIDNLDPRTGGILDLASIQIWTLERLTIERGANEVRLFLRSWRVERTTPYTRVDIATGNEDTNLYRGFYGKRFGRGQILQLAGQQYGTTSSRFAGGGDGLSTLGRVGIARDSWSVDAFFNRSRATRAGQPSMVPTRPGIAPLDATYTNAYIRGAIGARDAGPWLQLTAASIGFKGSASRGRSTSSTVPASLDTTETRLSEAQYNLAGGISRGPVRIELRDRLRTLGGSSFNNVSARADLEAGRFVGSVFAERDGWRGTTLLEAGARLQPLPFFAVSGAVSRTTSGSLPSPFPGNIAARAEAGVRLRGPWLTLGAITRDTIYVAPPIVYDTLLQSDSRERSTGLIASLRGPVWKGIGVDAYITRWDRERPYQPRYISRSELNFASDFLRRFPRGELSVRAAAIFESRGTVVFPLEAEDTDAAGSKVLSALLEVRIMRAVVSYQQRNILSYPYTQVPGFMMPRVLAIYGVRWEFWN